MSNTEKKSATSPALLAEQAAEETTQTAAPKKSAAKKSESKPKAEPKAKEEKPKAEKPAPVEKPKKEMSNIELKQYAEYLEIKGASKMSREKLLEACSIPDVDEEVKVSKKKDEPAIKAIFKGHFLCSKTDVFYAKLEEKNGGKKFIKQLYKVELIRK